VQRAFRRAAKRVNRQAQAGDRIVRQVKIIRLRQQLRARCTVESCGKMDG